MEKHALKQTLLPLSFNVSSPSIRMRKDYWPSPTEQEGEEEMDEIAVVLKRFGDEQSALLDQFERLSFQVQLNKAILGRSLSEPGASWSRFPQAPITRKQTRPLEAQVKQGPRPRRSRFDRLLKQLFKPILCTKGTGPGKKDVNVHVHVADPKDRKSWKVFSRSLRV